MALLAAKAEAARALDDPCFGYRLGALDKVDAFDIYGAAIVHASTLGEAIALGIRYNPVWEQGARMTLEHEGELALIVYANPLIEDRLADTIDSQQSVVFIARLIASMCPTLRAPIEVSCKGPAPRHALCMDGLRLSKVRAAFEQPRWAVGVARAELNTAMPGVHPAVASLLQQRLEGELNELDLALDLRARLGEQLRHGLRHGWGQAEVAAALGTSTRKLQLDLQGLGTSYSNELSLVREHLAKQLLAGAELPLKQIAERLGFASLASFSRFFRQQTGESPSSFRARRG